MKVALMLGILALAAGCSYTKNGTRHTLILGFGVVSVNATNQNLATVTKVTGIGFGASTYPGRAAVGYFNTVLVEVKSDTNVLIEIQDMPGKPITVKTP